MSQSLDCIAFAAWLPSLNKIDYFSSRHQHFIFENKNCGIFIFNYKKIENKIFGIYNVL